jgi:hypothetical protein
VYIGKVVSDYKYDPTVDSDEEGYPHQRWVEWLYNKKAIPRNMLTGRVYDSLKGRSTLFSTYYEDIDEIVKTKSHFFTQQTDMELKQEYLKKLQSGRLAGMNSNLLEDAICMLFRNYFPGLRRLATTSSLEGDTDLYAQLPGNVNIRIQAKHFYIEHGSIKPGVVEQLAKSMEVGDHGIIITTGKIGEAAIKRAEEYIAVENKMISFIDGEEFTDILFQNLDNIPSESLAVFGLAKHVGLL